MKDQELENESEDIYWKKEELEEHDTSKDYLEGERKRDLAGAMFCCPMIGCALLIVLFFVFGIGFNALSYFFFME